MSKIIMEMNFDRSPLSTSIYLTKLNNQGIYLLIILLYYTTSILLHLASFECTVKLKKCVHGAAALRFDRFLSLTYIWINQRLDMHIKEGKSRNINQLG